VKKISFDGTGGSVLADMGIEQAVYSKDTGFFYVNVPGTTANPSGYVAVIDPRDNDRNDGQQNDDQQNDHGHGQQGPHVVTNFKLSGNCAPTGGALGPNDELALFCSNGPEQVIDIRDGFLIRSIAGTFGGCDEGAFNAGDDHFVGACTDNNAGATDNLDISDANPIKFDAAIDTKTKGAHSVAADRITVSDWQPASAGTGANPGGLCGANPCVLIFKATGQDDPSESQQASAGHSGDH
jgi:hypothetical protein